jgi:hypothetical protein
MSSAVSNALDYLARGDLKGAVSSFVNGMDARPGCELPHHLAELGVIGPD